MEKRFPFAILIIGLSTISAQIVFIRQFSIVFYGNELSLGILLGNWLLWTALGSGIASYLTPKIKNPKKAFLALQAALVLFMPLTLYFIRSSRFLLDQTVGTIVGFFPIIWISFLELAPICIVSGALFSIACHLYSLEFREGTKSSGKIYFYEAIGSGIGGTLLSFILLKVLIPFGIILILSALNLIAIFLIFDLPGKRISGYIFYLTLLTALTILIIFLSPFLEYRSNIELWRGYELIKSKDTVYGNISITRLKESVSFFENGLILFTSPDVLNAEEFVHFSLLEHPEPEEVLLIGGGLGGRLEQILYHKSVKKVTYVELDPALISLARRYLPPSETKYLEDSRVSIYHMDGRAFVKGTEQKYDAVLINLPQPYTAQINRFYTLEFFREVKKILKPGGILTLSLSSSENYIGPELGNFLGSIYTTLNEVFPAIIVIPGETAHFIASAAQKYLTDDPLVLVDRIRERDLPTKYVRDYYLLFRMSQERLYFMREQIKNFTPGAINRDFQPIGYFYDIVLWDTYFRTGFKKFFQFLSRFKIKHVLLFLSVALFTSILLSFKFRKSDRLLTSGISATLAIVGFTEISLEVMIILIFQILYGYAFYQLAFIITCYMIGLSIGSIISTNRLERFKNHINILRMLQLSILLLPAVIMGVSYLYTSFQEIPGGIFRQIFPLFAGVAGFIGGFQFPVSVHLSQRVGVSVGKTAGRLYSIDLTGSFAGALLVSSVFIPLFGIPNTILLLMLLNSIPFAMIMIYKK